MENKNRINVIRLNQASIPRKIHPLRDWRFWAGGVGGLAFLYMLTWFIAVACVVAGYSQQVCGI